MSCHRGKHRKAKSPARVIAPGVVTAAALTGMILTPLAANAQVTPDPSASSPPPDLASNTALIQRYIPRHNTEENILVKAGDTLGSISAQACGTPGDWTGIYEKNKKIIGDNYNLIIPGQKLEKDCRTVVIPQITVVTSDVHYTPRHATAARSYQSSGSYGNVSPGNYSGFQRCVITRESGGNSQVMNSSGHYGLYQFSASTWQAYGGSASDFGHASASEQTRVFDNAMARGGQSNWSPYDGC